MTKALIVGYGNLLRRDDGVGREVARRFVGCDAVKVIEAHQLLPEHVDLVSDADVVVFVDAAANLRSGTVRCEAVVAGQSTGPLVDLHELHPAALLAAARDLYGREAQGWLVSIGVADLDHGEGLSPAVEGAVDVAVKAVLRCINPGPGAGSPVRMSPPV